MRQRCYSERIPIVRRRIRCADGSHEWLSIWMGRRGGLWRAGCAARPRRWGGLRRARAMLLLADGERFAHVAEQVGLAERHVRTWALRFRERGVAGLHDAARPGRRPSFPPGGGAARGQGGV